MEWWHFAVAAAWLVLLWLRRRAGHRSAHLSALDGRARDFGRGGF